MKRFKVQTVFYKVDKILYKLQVQYGMNYIQDNSEPYFSITANLFKKYTSNKWKLDSCGTLYDLIEIYVPSLEPLTSVHLYGQNTKLPMHYFANAKYHYYNDRKYFKEMCVLPEDFVLSEDVDVFLIKRAEYLKNRFNAIMKYYEIEFTN